MITREAYNFTLKYVGTKEVVGPDNNPMITIAHHLCGLSIENPTIDVDSSIPWCSSWVNLAIVCACIRRNPKRAVEMLQKRGIKSTVIVKCFLYAKMSLSYMNIDTGEEIVAPTWSANSKSWDTWGVAIPFDQAQRGDLVRLTRDGGGHISFLDEDSLGILSLKILGGNQSDQVCSSNRYSKTRLVHVRRA
jgi:hypothetical protein